MSTYVDMTAALCDQLLAAEVEPGVNLHALIDLANVPLESKRLRRDVEALGASCVLGDVALSTQLASPWLLPLDASQKLGGPLQLSADLALRSSAVSWLRTPLSVEDLAPRLLARMDARLPGRYDVLLRHFDPRVLPVLDAVLTLAQRTAFFALGSRWHYLDRESLLRNVVLLAAPAVDPFLVPLHLDEQQAGALLDAAEIDAVMPELAKEEPERFLALEDGAARYCLTRHCLARAQHWKLMHFPQKVIFCALALKLGKRFDEQPQWQQALANVAAGRMTLTAAIEQASGQ